MLDCGATNGGGTSIAKAVDHPDADTLTAYSERVLGSGERTQVLRHLAICGECREIVLLALPEAEAAAKAPVALPVARGWRALFTPRLGLAASALAAALVVGLIVESTRKPAPNAQKTLQAPNVNSTAGTGDVANQVAPPTASPIAGSIPSLSANPALPESKESNTAAALPDARAAIRSQANLAPNVTPAARSREATEVYDLRSTASTVATASPASITGVVSGERRDYLNAALFTGASTFDGSGTGNGSGIAKKELPIAPAPRAGSAWNSIPSAQIPDFTQLSSVPATARHTFVPPHSPERRFVGFMFSPAQKLFQRQLPLSSRMLALNNTMGGNGQLNPTKDRSQSVELKAAPTGRTEADLADSPAFSERARSKPFASGSDTEYGSGSSSWKVAGGRLFKKGEAGSWIEAYSAESIEFATFTAHGTDVWAGGHDAALIHSNDGGTTWERITLGSAASGIIVKIEAKGPNVQVVSSSGQSWTSVDGGKTWTRED
jgi:hypothetical protein